MFIYDILCEYLEYRRNGASWELRVSSKVMVDSTFIQNMIEAGYYFTSMGGVQEVDMKKNRRFGMQVSSITCVSFCGEIKKKFSFNYNNAKSINNGSPLT